MIQPTFFTADLHLSHENIIKYSNRPFANAQEMNEMLIDNFNTTVPKHGITYILGDVSFDKNVGNTISMLNKLNGKLVLIAGNHDTRNLKVSGFRDCFSDIYSLLDIKIDTYSITLCHYAMVTWNKSHRGALMLHGHSHGMLKDDPNVLRIDVGVDCHNYKPISFKEVNDIMSTKTWTPPVYTENL